MSGVGRWDGAVWSPLGEGISGMVYALISYDDGAGSGPAPFAGGAFNEAAGEVTANRIARWNGTGWEPVGEGLDETVLVMAPFDDGRGSGPALYVGGRFTEAGGVAASGIARWDGASWSHVGGGTSDIVRDLTVFDDGTGPALHVAGSFMAAGRVAAAGIARWNGSDWSALAGGVAGGPPESYVASLAVLHDGHVTGPSLYVGGVFTTAGGLPADHIARFVGCEDVLSGDLNGDGAIDEADLEILLGAWGACPDPPEGCIGDLDGDGTVATGDLLILLSSAPSINRVASRGLQRRLAASGCIDISPGYACFALLARRSFAARHATLLLETARAGLDR